MDALVAAANDDIDLDFDAVLGEDAGADGVPLPPSGTRSPSPASAAPSGEGAGAGDTEDAGEGGDQDEDTSGDGDMEEPSPPSPGSPKKEEAAANGASEAPPSGAPSEGGDDQPESGVDAPPAADKPDEAKSPSANGGGGAPASADGGEAPEEFPDTPLGRMERALEECRKAGCVVVEQLQIISEALYRTYWPQFIDAFPQSPDLEVTRPAPIHHRNLLQFLIDKGVVQKRHYHVNNVYIFNKQKGIWKSPWQLAVYGYWLSQHPEWRKAKISQTVVRKLVSLPYGRKGFEASLCKPTSYTMTDLQNLISAHTVVTDTSKCFVCNQGIARGKVLGCTSCKRGFHLLCLKDAADPPARGKPWHCPECTVPEVPPDPLTKIVCRVCDMGDLEETLLICGHCQQARHCECLVPPLPVVPDKLWFCGPSCQTSFEREKQEAGTVLPPAETKSTRRVALGLALPAPLVVAGVEGARPGKRRRTVTAKVAEMYEGGEEGEDAQALAGQDEEEYTERVRGRSRRAAAAAQLPAGEGSPAGTPQPAARKRRRSPKEDIPAAYALRVSVAQPMPNLSTSTRRVSRAYDALTTAKFLLEDPKCPSATRKQSVTKLAELHAATAALLSEVTDTLVAIHTSSIVK